MKLAVTGATGFIGSRLIERLSGPSHSFRALTRRPMPPRPNVTWIEGALDRPDTLAALVEGVDAVIHIAGLLHGRTAAQFDAVNVAGTRAMVDATLAAGVRRFVHLSSLAARHPEISLYGASKAKSEDLVSPSGLDFAIVRPPAVYGPGDRETLDLFRMASLGVVFLPSEGRLSLIHVDDLTNLLLALVSPDAPSSLIVEPDDGQPITQREFAGALGQAVGRRTRALRVPGVLLRTGALLDGILRGAKAKLTLDRAAYFAHPDWSVNPARSVPAAVWKPRIARDAGLAATVSWYRDKGWL